MEAGKKLPRKFPSLAESFGANVIDVTVFILMYVVQFSFFDKLKFIIAEIISANKVLFFVI